MERQGEEEGDLDFAGVALRVDDGAWLVVLVIVVIIVVGFGPHDPVALLDGLDDEHRLAPVFALRPQRPLRVERSYGEQERGRTVSSIATGYAYTHGEEGEE
jgi:hypothetical protein